MLTAFCRGWARERWPFDHALTLRPQHHLCWQRGRGELGQKEAKQLEMKQGKKGAKAYVWLDLPEWWRKLSLMFSSENQHLHSICIFKYMIILMIFHDLKSFDCQETPKCFCFVTYGFLMQKLANQHRQQKSLIPGGKDFHQLWLQPRINPEDSTQEQSPILSAQLSVKENFSLVRGCRVGFLLHSHKRE